MTIEKIAIISLIGAVIVLIISKLESDERIAALETECEVAQKSP